jgi:hypothetical protein
MNRLLVIAAVIVAVGPPAAGQKQIARRTPYRKCRGGDQKTR